jgi:sulfite reductase (NADPH) flavoprotein alpha-component
MARVRAHENFRLGENTSRPLILIGNGTGLAGLLGLIRARAAVGSGRIWLLYGERNAARDFHHRELIDAWHRDGVIERVDRVFSRDQASRRYVQHQLLAAADDVRRWVQAGAAVYVCGSLIGMAAGVDEVLRECVGPDALDELLETGRYRRDVY